MTIYITDYSTGDIMIQAKKQITWRSDRLVIARPEFLMSRCSFGHGVSAIGCVPLRVYKPSECPPLT
jgi:hypothetical protein